MAVTKKIYDIQKARAIVNTVGSKKDIQIIDSLLGAACVAPSSVLDYEKEAGEAIREMANKYTLKVANELWASEFDKLPNWIKEY